MTKSTCYILFAGLLTGIFLLNSCTIPEKNKNPADQLGWEVTLAQWSLHKSFFGDIFGTDWERYGRYLRESPDSLYQGVLHPDYFPEKAKELGYETIELVNTFYLAKSKNQAYWQDFKERADKAGVQVGLIMCDALGDLGNSNAAERQVTIEKHQDWIDIAEFLGAKTVRVNAGGDGTMEEVAQRVVESLNILGKYGAEKGINVVVENHGGYSSDASWVVEIIKTVNMENVGTLPDFDNFCIENGPDGCIKLYDRYKGVEDLMPYAKGVSAKALNFDQYGYEANMDYVKLLKIVKDSGFKGNIGIEYEGDDLTEEEGIEATHDLINKIAFELMD